MSLSHSLVGDVIGVGHGVKNIGIGDRVACVGLGHANHAEIVSIPTNLCVPVPARVKDEQAAHVMLCAIAMHGIRQAGQQLGSAVLVVGLGLVGQIAM